MRSRRRALALLAASGASIVSGAHARRASAQSNPAASACIVRPEQTEGPFFVDERLNRTDIRSDPVTGAIRPGIPLRVTFRVSRVEGATCTLLSGAQVDLWHCDAAGAYSDVRDSRVSTVGQKFLRGYQLTNENGVAVFTTIYPGWYRRRAVHLHFKVRSPAANARAREFTSQIYFDDALSDRVFTQAPYASRGRRDLRNDQDGLFARGGRRLVLPLAEDARGYAGVFDIALNMG